MWVTRWLLCAALILLAPACLVQEGSARITIGQALRLSAGQVRQGRTVEVEAVLTFVDEDANALYCQDETGAILVNAVTSLTVKPLHGMIRVRGTLSENGAGQRRIEHATVEAIPGVSAGRVKQLSTAVPAAPDDFLRLTGRRVTVRGVLLNAESGERSRQTLELESHGRVVEVQFLRPYGLQTQGMLNREVTVQGIAAPVVGVDQQIEKYLVRSVPATDLQVVPGVAVRPPPRVTLSQAHRMVQGGLPKRVTVEGTISYSTALGQLMISDGTGTLPVLAAAGVRPGLGRLRVTAMPATRNGHPVLAGAAFDKVPGDGRPEPASEVLRTVQAVRRLPHYLADLRQPVEVECTLTFANVFRRTFFCEDATAGIYLGTRGPPNRPLRAGDRVRVRGISGAGDFAPVIQGATLEYVSHPGLPPSPAIRQSWESGLDDGQWRRISGLVLSADRDQAYLQVHLLTEGRLVTVFSMDGAHPSALTGRLAEVRGVMASLFNNRRQLVGYKMFAPEGTFRLLPEQRAVRPALSRIQDIGRFSLDRTEQTPYRIEAVVTHLQPPQGAYVADSTGGILVQAMGEIPAAVGDRVEVIGYVGRGSFSPFLQFASVRFLSGGQALQPVPAKASDAAQGLFDSRLISVEGVLLQEIRNSQDRALIMQSGSVTFTALLDVQAGPLRVDPGSKVRLTGVAINQGALMSHVLVSRGFEMRLRKPADVAVLRQPAWWSSERVQFLLALIAGLLVAGLCWVYVLRRQVRRQTKIIESQLENEAALRRKANEANQAKSRFLATMSHEIRTPLNGILGFARLVHEESTDPDQREKLGIIRHSSEALLTIINEVLDFSKIEAGRMTVETAPLEPAEVARTVSNLFSEMARSKGLELACRVDPAAPPAVLGDPVRLRQILMNLVGNAIKFTQAGSVRVSVDLVRREGSRCWLRYAVEDTGCGIAPDKLNDIFEAFQQADNSIARRFGGTGLGLAISRKLARLMGGDIVAESVVGQGSRFQLDLWLEEHKALAAAPIASGGSATEPAVCGPCRVLVAEDNATNQLLVRRLLERRGHQVTLVGNGREAVEAASAREFDVILLDIEMPEVDGFQALSQLRERATAAPIVALTAHAMQEDRLRMAQAGFDGFVAKPIDWAMLEAEIARVVSERAQARRLPQLTSA